MGLQDYTTEELRAELKRRNEIIKAEKAKVKRCRMCKHWGAITYFGKPVNYTIGNSHPCRFFKTKNGKYYRCHTASQLACEHFEQVNND